VSGPCRLAHVEQGRRERPPLVLSSSLGTSGAMWDRQAPGLAAAFRVIRYDHRGHGSSPVPPGPYELADLAGDVVALLDELGLERASFAGVSLGGMVGLWLAANAPGRIERLIVICSSAHMPPASAWALRAATVRRTGGTEAIADAVLARWLTPGFAAANPGIAAGLREMLVATPAEGYASCCGAIERMDLRDSLARIAVPTLVIAGEHDPSAPPDQHGRAVAAAIAGARLEILPAAHLAGIELPGAVNELIIEHMEEQPT
jgi:3-oxoadipate enol-lactonase